VYRRNPYPSQNIVAAGTRRPKPFYVSWQFQIALLAELPRRSRKYALRTKVAKPLAVSPATDATGRKNQVEKVGTESMN